MTALSSSDQQLGTTTASAQSHSSDASEDPAIVSSDTQFKSDPADYTMHGALADLMEAEKLLASNVSVKGTFFIEVTAGECINTFGVLMRRVPCLKPWDIVFGEAWNVLTRGQILMDLAEKGRIDAFLGMPCQSFTHARIPALRNAEFPEGKPGLSTRQQDLVDTGNRLAAWTLAFIMVLHAAHRYFTVENPYMSWLWWLPEWRKFKQRIGVITTLLQQRCYGWITRKDTFFLHNNPLLPGMGTSDVECPSSDVVLRGLCRYEGQTVFRTKLSQSYPPNMAIAYGIIVEAAMEAREEAVSRGHLVPHADSRFDDGLPS